MASRLHLQEELETLLGTRNVYFQPPETLKMRYPCIVYNLNKIVKTNADNRSYTLTNCYTVMVITNDPDDALAVEILKHFEMCSFDRQYRSDNLYHNVLTLYY